MWRLDCRLKYVWYLMLIKFVIFDYFWGKIRLFLMSLWRALHWNATTPPHDFINICLDIYKISIQTWIKSYDIFAWRCEWIEGYILPIVSLDEFHVFWWFWGKIRLFLKVLVAGVAGEDPLRTFYMMERSWLSSLTFHHIKCKRHRYICVTVGLSSEV